MMFGKHRLSKNLELDLILTRGQSAGDTLPLLWRVSRLGGMAVQREVQPCEGESREREQVGRCSGMLGENCPGHMKGGGYPVGLGVGLVEGGSPWCRCQPLPT